MNDRGTSWGTSWGTTGTQKTTYCLINVIFVTASVMRTSVMRTGVMRTSVQIYADVMQARRRSRPYSRKPTAARSSSSSS